MESVQINDNGVFIGTFEQISHNVLLFVFWTSKYQYSTSVEKIAKQLFGVINK